MKTAVFSWRGRQGKSCISFNLHKHKKNPDSIIITNEESSPLVTHVDKKRLLILKEGHPVPWNQIPDSWNVIFDLGGFMEGRVREIIKKVDQVILPIVWEKDDMLLFENCLQCLTAVTKNNPNVLVVLNNTETSQIDRATKAIKKLFPKTPILTLKKSKVMLRSFNLGISVRDVANHMDYKAHKWQWSPVADQFDKIFNYHF